MKDILINYDDLEDQNVQTFLHNLDGFSFKEHVYLIPPFMYTQIGKINLLVDCTEKNFSDIKEKRIFLREIKDYFGNDNVNIHTLDAVQEAAKNSEVIREEIESSLAVKLELSEIVRNKTINFQWEEKKKSKKASESSIKIVHDSREQIQDIGEGSPLEVLKVAEPELAKEIVRSIDGPAEKRQKLERFSENSKQDKSTLSV